MLSRDALKSTLRRIAREEPEFFRELLGSRVLGNPCPPDQAGEDFGWYDGGGRTP